MVEHIRLTGQKFGAVAARERAAAVKHTTRTLSGPPSTGAAIAMYGGVADTACYYTLHRPFIGGGLTLPPNVTR